MSRSLLAGLIVFCLALYSAAPLAAKGGKGGGGKGHGGGSHAKSTRTHGPSSTHGPTRTHGPSSTRTYKSGDRHTPTSTDRHSPTRVDQNSPTPVDHYPGSHGKGHDRHAGEPHTPGSHRPDRVKNKQQRDGDYEHDGDHHRDGDYDRDGDHHGDGDYEHDGRFERDGEYRHDNGLLHGRQHALEVQRRNEERKLEQRLDRANQLRQLAADSGDESMADMADRIEQQATDHYDKRMAKIDEFRDRFGLTEDDPLGDSPLGDSPVGDSPLGGGDAVQSLTDALAPSTQSPTSALTRQVLDQQRVLDQQLQRAEQLRALGESTGSQRLLDAADRVEEMALDRFDRSLEGIDDLAPQVLEPLEPIPTSVPTSVPFPRYPLRRLFGF